MKKVTQIVAYYNEEKYIARCLESLLKQSYTNLEIIMISDGSTDRSPEIVSGYSDDRIIIINNKENRGQAFCRNQGLDIATGEYIGFFDGDDISDVYRIEKFVDFLESHEDIFGVSCSPQYIDEDENIILGMGGQTLYDKLSIRAEMLMNNPIFCSATIFRNEIVQRYNIRQNVEYRTAQDYHFWLQCLKYGDFANVNERLFYYRQYESQTKKIINNNKDLYEKWMKEIFEYAWVSRGFKVSEQDIDFVHNFLYQEKLLWRIKNLKYYKGFISKIRKQVNILDLEESKEILKAIRKRYNRNNIIGRIFFVFSIYMKHLFNKVINSI